MKIKAIMLILLFPVMLSAQDSIDYRKILSAVVENSPRLKDKELLSNEGELKLENIAAYWMPSMTVNGKASYQSDVVSLDIPIPGVTIPEMPHGQFGLNLDIRQNIYDGGFSKKQKAYEQANTVAALKKVDVDIHALKVNVSTLYFAILIMDENYRNLQVVLENLKSREEIMLSAAEHGAILESEVKQISVEVLKTLQAMSEIAASKSGALRMLEVYTGLDISKDAKFPVPYLEFIDQNEIQRPELAYLSFQAEVLESGKQLAAVRRMPVFYAFGQAGVGMPGYNMLSDEIDGYYMVGAGLQWKIWDWNTVNREKQILETKQQVLDNARESLNMSITAGLEKEVENMKHYKNALNLDEQMLKMRIEISENAASQLDNGVISAADYLQMLNEETMARIRLSMHKVQLVKSIANYQLLCGQL